MATTGTADLAAERRQARYIGRFAPSPTGKLHLGSLVAGLGSFLDARHHGGRWLVRIEDLDVERVEPGSAAEILGCLEALGLYWDGEVRYQSRHTARHTEALERLTARGLTYECSCSRRDWTAPGGEARYPGTCRNGAARPGPAALRFRVSDSETVRFADRIQGPCEYSLRQLGDVVIRRRDGVTAYQLAVVVDDAEQGITHVVRGADLIASTAWQIALSRALGTSLPCYAHLPVVVEPDGAKLAKSRHSVPIEAASRHAALTTALRLLGLDPGPELAHEAPERVLRWAVDHWRIRRLRGIPEIPVPPG
ncbi:MAG: tRNA glutamyl-Q(34) synthetase GluQRS [Steroidobacteraceae bacterium]